VPGFPHFAQNGRVAYCVTHAFVDIHDLYVERFDEGARHVAFRDAWLPVTRRVETVAIRGAAPRQRRGGGDASRPGHRRRSGVRHRAGAALRPVRRDRPLLRLPAAHAARRDVASLFEATRGWG
jgi:penicillin amidase